MSEPEYDRAELHADMKVFIGDRRPHYKSMYEAFDAEPLSALCLATSAEEAIPRLELYLSYNAVITALVASINRSAHDGDEQRKKTAEDLVRRLEKQMEKHTSWAASNDPKMHLISKAAKKAGYQLNELEQNCVDFLEKWSTDFRSCIDYTMGVRREHEVTFVGALLAMGAGEHIAPFNLLLHKPVKAKEVAKASTVMLEAIEEAAHAWLLTNMVTQGSVENLLFRMQAHPDLGIFPCWRDNGARNVVKAVHLADRTVESLVPGSASVFEQEIVLKPGQDAVEAIREAVDLIMKTAKDPHTKLKHVVLMDDDGRVVTLQDFFDQRGEEVPESVLDNLRDDEEQPGAGS